MGLKESLMRWKEKKDAEKEELKSMEREIRFRKRIEQKMKSPQQKEYEFYQKEHAQDNLDRALKIERENRKKRMMELSNPFNKPPMFKENSEILKGGIKWL